MLNLDQTGLAQKGGAVLEISHSHRGPDRRGQRRWGSTQQNLYLVLDALGGLTPVNLDRAHPTRTVAVVNTTPNPTGGMISNNTILFPTEASIRRKH